MVTLAGSYHCAELTPSDGTIEFTGRLSDTDKLITAMRAADPDATPAVDASDSEVALQAYRIWGIDGFRRLSGPFALAIAEADRLVLARDLLGIEPLYYAHDQASSKLRYATTIAALLDDGPEAAPAARVVHRYLTIGALDDEPDTFFEGVRRVMPGEAVVAEASGVRRQSFRRARAELLPTSIRPATDAAAELRRRLTAALGQPEQPAAAVAAGPGWSALAEVALQAGVEATLTPVYLDPAVNGGEAESSGGALPLGADEFKADWAEFIRTQEEPTESAAAYLHYRLARLVGPGQTLITTEGTSALLVGGQSPTHPIGKLARTVGDTIGKLSGGMHTELARSLVSAELRSRYSDEGPAPIAAEPVRARIEAVTTSVLPARLRSLAKSAAAAQVRVALPFLDLDTLSWLLGQDRATLTDLLGQSRPADADPPLRQWLLRIKNTVYDVFMSESFANRGYFDQTAVVETFEAFIKRPTDAAASVFWRLLGVELWCREFFDVAEPEQPTKIKTDLEANDGKELDLALSGGGSVRRYPLRTELFSADDDLEARVVDRVAEFFASLIRAGGDHRAKTTDRWYLFISEKIVAITQGRSMFVWDIKVSRAARVLSKFVTRTPTGIGLGSPFTMQLAIGEAGLPRILFASAGSVVGKLTGRSGVFYQLVGHNVRAIDGPTEYSAYPSNVSAKLPPKDPDRVAAQLTAAVRARLPEPYASTFAGTVVMDANDLGRNALGKDVDGDPATYEAMFADNPLGQGSQQTPLAIVFPHPPRGH